METKMDIRSRFGIATLVILLAIVFIFGLAQAFSQELEPSDTSVTQADIIWISQYVHRSLEPAINVGTHNSTAIHPVDHKPRISYYDSTNGNLMLARPVATGSGNCGEGDSWDCDVIDDSENDVGQFSSLDYWVDEENDKYSIGISYYDATLKALKYYYQTCSTLACTIPKIVTISYSTINPLVRVGRYSSLKFGLNGIPHIAYTSINLLNNKSKLRLAYYVGDGSGNCGMDDALNDWVCNTIDSGINLGQSASLDMDVEGQVKLAYYDQANGDLKLATYWGFDGNCGYDENDAVTYEWNCVVVDGEDSDTGLFASIQAPKVSGDKTRIAYYDKSNQKLRYAETGSGGDCGTGWVCLNVDDMGFSVTDMDLDMVLDQDGHPFIAYQQIQDELSPSVLRIARPYFVYDDGEFGNCGEIPPGYDFIYWRCNTLDNAGASVEEADFVSLAVDLTGMAYIAYSEWDSYNEVDSLKIMYQAEDTTKRLYLPTTVK
jgi:hypothetical protein